MKTKSLLLGMAVVAVAFTSCKNEKEEAAKVKIDTYVVYVDSLGNVSSTDAKPNWQAIDASYQMRAAAAEAALADMKDKAAAQASIDASKAKYEAMKAKMKADMDAEKAAAMPATPVTATATAANPKQQLRDALFGAGKIGEDMNFSWVNKDNIHSVYQNFVSTAENNKDKYSREDWDEVKVMWEALDSRKNTVEKEGLSSKDNMKIAGLKMKFAPMLLVNRMGAKNSEMKKAKK